MNLSTIDLQTLTFLGKGFAFTALIVLAAALFMRQASAQSISLYWRAGIVGLIVLPLVALFLPVLPVWQAAEMPAIESQAAALYTPSTLNHSNAVVAPAPPVDAGETSPFEGIAWSWIRGLWLVGACGVLLRWGIARFKASKLRRRARPSPARDWLEKDQPAGRLRVFVSETASIPMVWGTFRPVLLLPEEAEQWDEPTRQAVLAHELSHIRRRDSLFLLLANCAVALHWPNPFAWMAARKLRLADERSADDSVLANGTDPSEYASVLVEFAKRGKAPTLGLPLAAPSMAHPSTIGRRVERMLDPTQRRNSPRLGHWLGSAAAVLAIATTIGALTSKQARAQDKPTPPAAPAPISDGARSYISKKLDKTVIPKVEFKNASLNEALVFLRLQSEAHDPFETEEGKKGVNIIAAGGVEGLDEPKITLKLSDVSLKDALEFVTKLTGTEYKIDPIAVVIAPQASDSHELFTRTFRVTAGFLATVGPGKAREYLVGRGVTFPDGSNAVVIAGKFQLVVRNTAGNMERIQAIVSELNADPIVGEKLRTIVLPTVRLDNATIEESLEFLRRKSMELDIAEEDPDKKGINIILRRPPPDPVHKDLAITLHLSDIPLGDALRYVADGAGLEMQVLPHGVVMGNDLPPIVPKLKLTPAQSKIEAKAKEIIIPEIVLDEATVEEAVGVLRQRSRELDKAKEGLNIMLHADGSADLTITLKLSNVPLLDAMGYVAELAGAELKISDVALEVVPKEETWQRR